MGTKREPQPLPLHLRIDLAEAFCELVWTTIQTLPASRGGVIADARYRVLRDAEMAKIDRMLEEMLPWYDERILLAAGNLDAPEIAS